MDRAAGAAVEADRLHDRERRGPGEDLDIESHTPGGFRPVRTPPLQPMGRITAVRALHLSGADEQGPQDAVIIAVGGLKDLWSLRLNREPRRRLFGSLGGRMPSPPGVQISTFGRLSLATRSRGVRTRLVPAQGSLVVTNALVASGAPGTGAVLVTQPSR
jgi:hypothetical protein